MPKDATKNVDRYKIRGGQLNEFEYTENQKALAGKKAQGEGKLIPGTPPEEAAQGLQPAVKAKGSNATKGAKNRATKGTKGTKGKASKKSNNSSTKGAAANKRAARKTTAKKSTARKTATQKRAAKK